MEDNNTIKTAEQIKGDAEIYDPRRKREIIKTILIIFLAALLVLTFFSNTIMNKSLAEITTERTSSGKLTERLRASGTVESNQSYEVKLDGNRTIDTINVKRGSEVKKGDVLFKVGGGESEAVITAETELETLELEYQKAMLTPPDDFTEENQAVKNARDDLSAAIAKRDKAASEQANVNAAKNAYNSNKSQSSYYSKLQAKLQSMITAIDTDDYISAPAEYTGDILVLKNAYDTALAEYSEALEAYNELSEAGETPDEAAKAAAKADMEAKKAVRDSAKADYSSAKFALRNDIAAKLADAEANAEYYGSLVNEYESSNTGSGMGLDELNADVQTKQRLLEEQLSALSKSQKAKENDKKLTALDLEAKKKAVEKAREKLNKLKEKDAPAEIKSQYSGIVSDILIRPGDTTVPDSALMTIDLADEGYTLRVPVDAEKVKKVQKGTSAEIINNWNGDMEAVLTDIQNDTVPNSKKRILVFSVTGDVDPGTYLDLSIPCGSGDYDNIIPKSALGHDNDGDFVLTVIQKDSPLGNRYYANRVPVEILASDELTYAVSGDIGYGEYVITAASKPVYPKDQVRMKDE